MFAECDVGHGGPRIDRGEEAVLAPTAQLDSALTRRIHHPAIAREHVGGQVRGIVGLPTLGLEAGVFQVAMIIGGIRAQQERRKFIVVVDRVRIVEERREAAARRGHRTLAQPRRTRLQNRRRSFVFVGKRLEMDQLSELFLPVCVVAMIDNGARPRDDLALAPRDERLDFEYRTERAAMRQQIDLVLNIGRPPCFAVGVHDVRQARELRQLGAAARIFDTDTSRIHQSATYSGSAGVGTKAYPPSFTGAKAKRATSSQMRVLILIAITIMLILAGSLP